MLLDLSLRIIAIICLTAFCYWYKQKDTPNPKYWRVALYKRRLRRWDENVDWQRDLPNMRPLLLMLLAGGVYKATQCIFPGFKLDQLTELKHAGDATLLLALMGSPFAFVIWWFKDINNREQLENQRKDVNLKDFQRLAEWAAGMHLPEDKITTSLKTTEGATVEPNPETKTSRSTENNQSTECYVVPSNAILHTPSRREGAASLQIAAIYQLQSFLQGDYGKHFQRPAFQLLKSVWLSMVSQHINALNTLLEQPCNFAIAAEKDDFTTKIEAWRAALQSTMAQSVGYAINVTLGAQQGYLLRTHAIDLSGAVLSGYNSRHSALKQPLELDDLNLNGIQLQGADLRGAELQRANLSFAQLQGVSLVLANLQGANLSNTKLQWVNLNLAELQGAHLREAQLQGARLMQANLQWANLGEAQLQGATLMRAKLQGAHLEYTQLQGANLWNIEVDKETNFLDSTTNDNTQVFISLDYPIVDISKTFAFRDQLRNENGLKLPDILYQQLFAEPTEYTVLNTNGQKEIRTDVGKRQ